MLSIFGLLPLVFLSGEVGQLLNNPLIYNSRFWCTYHVITRQSCVFFLNTNTIHQS